MKNIKLRHKDSFLKRLEYKIKAIIDNFLNQRELPERVTTPIRVFNINPNFRILLLRHDRIGDLLVSVPFIKILRNMFPEITIDILLSSNNISASAAFGHFIDNVYIFRKQIGKQLSLFRKLRKNRYDLIIDLFDNPSTTSSILIKFIKPKYALGLDKSNSTVYTHIVPLLNKNEFHIVERISNLLLAFGIKPDQKDLQLEFYFTNSELEFSEKFVNSYQKNKILGINLSGSSRAKYWGTQNFIELINKIRPNYPDFAIVIFSTNDYKNESDEICKHTNSVPAINCKSFGEFASLISKCDYLITPDTSVVHLASAFRIPVVSLHLWTGSDDTGLPWYAYNTPTKYLITDTNNLSDISPNDVYNSFSELFNQ